MIDADKLDYAKTYLRRKLTLVQIKALADTVASAILAGETKVTVTQTFFEGGQTMGQVEFEAAIVGKACEDLIKELDPTAPRVFRSLGSVVVYSTDGFGPSCSGSPAATPTTVASGTGAIFSFAMPLNGNVVQGQTFGFFLATQAIEILNLSLVMQSPDAAAGLTVVLINGSGVPYGPAYFATAAAGADHAVGDFSAASLILPAGSIVRCKVSSYVPSADASAPAQFLAAQITARQ